MPTGPTNPLPKYSIVSITPEDDLSTPGRIIPSQRVAFTADGGVSGSVLVPDTQITDVNAVRTLVEGRLTALVNVMRLGG